MSERTEATYRAAVERWMAGDLGAARQLLEQALAGSDGPATDPWWFATSRAMAHVAMDQGDLALAATHLARVPFDLIGAAQTIVLQARLAHLRGDDGEAAQLLSAAVQRVLADAETDIAPLMNGAIALANAAELLAELGFAEEAVRVVGLGRARVDRAGVDDPSVDATFSEVERSAAGVANPRTDPVPVERWNEVRASRDIPAHTEANDVAYAVVVTLVVDGDAERYAALDRSVCDLLDADPDLGEVDGTGTDGDVWELFVDGDDPESLWAAIEPLVVAARPPAGSRAVISLITGERREVALGA